MPKAYIVVGLAYGDESKGGWVDHVVRKHSISRVVRFNGGAQAGHQVITPDGRSHIFSQFGSGTFAGAETLLSRFMLIDPETLFREASVLETVQVTNPLGQLVVSENAPVITPMNRYLNRVMETIRGAGRHGSCGFGIGITQADVEGLGDDALYVRDLRRDGGRAKLTRLYELKRAKLGELDTSRCPDLVERFDGINLDAYAHLFRRFYHNVRVISEEEFLEEIRDNDTVFEGAQGVLLDQQHGFFPHCTRSNCTFENPLRLLSEAEFQGDITRVGLLRGYATRHGAGPFPTEDPTLVVPPCHNHTNDWQGHFRNGWFDGISARYALEVTGGVDCLAITNLDRMDALPDIKICESYESTADAEFLRNGSIPLVGDDLDVLARRTAEICKAVPRYVNVKGWADGNLSNRDTYLDTLEEIMNHEIHAFSVSPHHQKTYRCSQRIFA